VLMASDTLCPDDRVNPRRVAAPAQLNLRRAARSPDHACDQPPPIHRPITGPIRVRPAVGHGDLGAQKTAHQVAPGVWAQMWSQLDRRPRRLGWTVGVGFIGV
jgi:hypothetical protein